MFKQKLFAMLAILMSSSISANQAIPVDTSSPCPELVETADSIASQYYEMGWFSGTILVAKSGDLVFSKSYGVQDLNTKFKNSVNTKYNLGSIAKNYTKVLILQQVEMGKLRLTDTLDKFDLGFPYKTSNEVTIEQLLNHTAGFADIFIAEYREDQLAFDTLDKKLNLLIDTPLIFEPGSDYKYSNYGYIVLGAILEKVSNKKFTQLLSENIFKRISLNDTTFTVDESDKNQSSRYSYSYAGSLNNVGVTEHPSPDGGIESTVEDVQRFYRKLFYSNSLLNNQNPVVRNAFAMDGEHWGAYGGGLGISAAVEVDLVNDVEIVVLANSDNLVAEFISQRVMSFLKTGTYEEVKQLEINFAYDFYSDNGKDLFYSDFRGKYIEFGYSQFLGRTINELGMQLIRAQSWTEAFDIFYYLTSLYPDAPQVYDSLAFAYSKKGDTNKALSTFKKALTLKPDFKSDYVNNNYGLK